MSSARRAAGSRTSRLHLISEATTARSLHTLSCKFGVYRGVGAAERAAWLDAVRKAAESAGIAWCHWGFAAEFGLYDLESGSWDPPLLDALGMSS